MLMSSGVVQTDTRVSGRFRFHPKFPFAPPTKDTERMAILTERERSLGANLYFPIRLEWLSESNVVATTSTSALSWHTPSFVAAFSGLLRQQREEEERDVGLAIFLHRSRCTRKIYINHWALCCSSRFNKLGDYDESEANVHHQRKARHADKRER